MSKPEKIYGIVAGGICYLSKEWETTTCKHLFTNLDDAKAEIPKFIKRLCEPTDDNLECYKRNSLVIKIFEYELIRHEKKFRFF